MTTYLLDADVLTALTVAEHQHHAPASRWAARIDTFALCPVVEGALVRFLVRLGESGVGAQSVLQAVRALPGCEFWGDTLSYVDADLTDVRGHRQVTDSYLVALARSHSAVVATFDRALAGGVPDATFLLPGEH